MKKLITEFYGMKVFAIDKIDTLILEYDGGENPLELHLNIFTGELEEEKTGDVEFILNTLNDWYDTFKSQLMDMYESGEYNSLPNWEE